MVKRKHSIKDIKDKIRKIVIEKEMRKMGKEPTLDLIEEMMKKRKVRSPVIKSYIFHKEKIKPAVHDFTEKIEKSETAEIKVPIEKFADEIGMKNKPDTSYIKSKPFLYIEGLSTKLSDGKKNVIIKKTTKEDILPEYSEKLLNDICKTDPQTNLQHILEFQKKVCKFVKK